MLINVATSLSSVAWSHSSQINFVGIRRVCSIFSQLVSFIGLLSNYVVMLLSNKLIYVELILQLFNFISVISIVAFFVL